MASYPTSTRTTSSRIRGPAASKFGLGVAYPVRRTPTGGLTLASSEEYIRGGIRHFFDTLPGEGVRAFDSINGIQYGSRLRKYQFESIEHIKSVAEYELRRGLAVWEPRILVREISFQGPTGPTSEGLRTVKILLSYTLRSTGEQGSTTFDLRMKAR